MTARVTGSALAILIVSGLAAMLVPAEARVATHPRAADEPSQPLRWLALGDSYSSGEGVNENYGYCAQSPGAYAAKAHSQLAMEGYPVGDQEFLACTGAQIPNVTKSDDLVEQIERSDGRYDLITLTIGGNDAGFSDVLTRCILHPLGCEDEAVLARQVDAVRPSLVRIYQRMIDERLAPGGHIVVLGYPRIFEAADQWHWSAIDSCEMVWPDDADMIRRLVDRMNAMIADVAAQFPDVVHHLDVAESFEGHNLCAGWQTTNEWVNGLSLGWSGTNRFPGRPMHSFHPNRDGHAAEADLLVDTIKKLDWGRLRTAGNVTLRSGGLTMTTRQPALVADFGRSPKPRGPGVVEVISVALGEPSWDKSGLDIPAPCVDTMDRWVMWGPPDRPVLAAAFATDRGVTELVGYRTYANSPHIDMADHVPIGASASRLRAAAVLGAVRVGIIGRSPFGTVEFELRGFGRGPLGPELGELSGTRLADQVVARGSGVQCALISDPDQGG